MAGSVQEGNIEASLHLLALVLDDVQRAQVLCQKTGSKEAHMFLLKMLLHPPDGRPSKYVEACRVLASPGLVFTPFRPPYAGLYALPSDPRQLRMKQVAAADFK